MSKNTREANFRKVDVDELDEEQFRDDQEGDEDQGVDQVGQREAEVKKLTSSGNNVEALKVALTDPPAGSKDKSAKDRNFTIVMDVLTRFRATEVEKAVNSLNTSQVDVLMKYLYRGFAQPSENSCGILLVWHEKAVGANGLGCIIRVLTDRKTI